MAKSQTNYSTNASNVLSNDAQGLTNQLQGQVPSYLSGLGGAQSSQQSTLGTLFPALSTDLTTGGFNPTQLGALESSTTGLTQTGGYDPTQLATVTGGYTSLAKNGGFNPQQSQQFIDQATEGTTSTYNILEQQAQQARAATGGLGTGGDYSQLARQLTQAQGQGTLNAEVALNQQKTQNKLAGLGGLSSTEAGLASSRLAANNQNIGLQSNVAQGSETASGQLGSLFNTQTGQVTAMGSQLLQALGLSYNTQAEAAGILQQLSKNPGALQTALGDIAGLGGAAAGAASGLGVGV